MAKNCQDAQNRLTPQFLRLSLARFSREIACLLSRKNLGNESVIRNCHVRQVLCTLTILCRFKPKNVCIFPRFSRFQLFQSEIILLLNQSINQSINQSTDRPTDRPTDQPTKQPTNQPTTNQSINQSYLCKNLRQNFYITS